MVEVATLPLAGASTPPRGRGATVADYLALPEGAPVQLIEGELVAMAQAPDPEHQFVSFNLAYELAWRIRQLKKYVAVTAPFDLHLDEGNVYQPDLLVFADATVDGLGRRRPVGLPLLVVEILSPGSKRHDLWTKRRHYAAAGIAEMWIVDPADRTIAVFRALDLNGEPVDFQEANGTLATPLFPGLAIDCAELWPSAAQGDNAAPDPATAK